MKQPTTERRGGVYELGQVIDPELAMQLGAKAIILKDEYLRRNYGLGFGTGLGLNVRDEQASGETELTAYSNSVLLSESDTRLVEEANKYLEGYIGKTGLKRGVMSSTLFVGAAAGGNWHLDVMRDWRMLVNLSRFPISITIATDWDPGDWVSSMGYPKISNEIVPPRSSTKIEYNPGEAVVVDNACRPRDQVPHFGSTEDGKVFLRTEVDEDFDRWDS